MRLSGQVCVECRQHVEGLKRLLRQKQTAGMSFSHPADRHLDRKPGARKLQPTAGACNVHYPGTGTWLTAGGCAVVAHLVRV
jgi:hypothetical protein